MCYLRERVVCAASVHCYVIMQAPVGWGRSANDLLQQLLLFNAGLAAHISVATQRHFISQLTLRSYSSKAVKTVHARTPTARTHADNHRGGARKPGRQTSNSSSSTGTESRACY